MAQKLRRGNSRDDKCLMSVSQGSLQSAVNEKPTVMVTNCPAMVFTSRVSVKARLLTKDAPNISKERNTRASKTCVRISPAEYSCSTSGADSTSVFWPVWT